MIFKISLVIIPLGILGAYYLQSGERRRKSVIVNTPFGNVKGYREFSRDSRAYWEFRGVPFAQPPVGPLRFKPPQPIEPWGEGEMVDAKSQPPSCIQFNTLTKRQEGSENCLFLNIFTPNVETKGALPVMVFIHGGSFLYGGSELYHPQYFMDEDVILVTVQYRHGIFGFLNTEDGAISGNMGLKDQREALKWVQKAIGSFGGDASKVTIFGESSGSACVHYHLLSNRTNGLISRGIMQSGTALGRWALVNNPRKQAYRVGKLVGCANSSTDELTGTDELAECLRSIDASELIHIHATEEEFWSEKFGPSVEHPVSNEARESAFLLQPPGETSSKGNYAKIPLMMGFVPMEGSILAYAIVKKLERINEDWNQMGNHVGIYDPIKLGKVRELYFGPRVHFTEEDLDTFTQLISESNFFKWGRDAAISHLLKKENLSPTPLYLYEMRYEGRKDRTEFGVCHLIRAPVIPYLPAEFSLVLELLRVWIYDMLGLNVRSYGVCHADELKYLFMQHPTLRIDKGSPNYEFSKYFVKLWVSFATNGKPSEGWEAARDPNALRYFEISGQSKSKMVDDPNNSDRLSVWDSLYSGSGS